MNERAYFYQNAPHSLVSAAQSGGGIWGKNAVDYLEPTPIERYINECPVETILKEAGLDRLR
jgi:hypothetical protein